MVKKDSKTQIKTDKSTQLEMEELEKIKKALVENENAIIEANEKHQRALADYQNLLRRTKENESLIIKTANAALIEKLLVTIDHLLLAENSLKDPGLRMIIDSFLQTLESEGLKQIKTDHQEFDPYTMDCVDIVPGEKDKVISTLSQGYLLYDKVLRPAKVKVGSGQPSLRGV